MVKHILYVGQPDLERTAAFTDFLGQHFSEVRTSSLEQLDALDLDDVDVVIVDGEYRHTAQLPAELAASMLPRPTMLIGGIGGRVSDGIGLKLGWDHGCLCLDHRAIVDDETLEHPIFSGPVPVPAPAIETIPSPENFLHYSATKDVPEKVQVTDIHAGRVVSDEEAKALQARAQSLIAAGDVEAVQALMAEQPTPGLVSTSAGFFDSPDCERILGGINMKAHDYIAVGRQGRFLSWGFHGDPTVMTDLGKALFLNAIHYINEYVDAPVEALRVKWSREILHTSLGFVGAEEAGDPAAFLGRLFHDGVPAGIGTTSAEALAWWAVNRGYIRHTGSGHSGNFEVDADLLSLGIANDDITLLDLLAPLLGGSDEDAERARRLWRRYVRRDPSDATREQAWLAEHRNVLFFSDWAGYRWIARDDLPEFSVPQWGQTEDGPVTVTVSAGRDGDIVQATVAFALEPGHYLYAPGATDGIPVSITPATQHELVSTVFPASADFHLTGYTQVRLQLRGDPDDIELDVTVQVCNEQSCTPPTTLRVKARAAE